jgi:CheY-like chemotaxis protein
VAFPDPLFSIGAVAAMLHSTPATLRSWEERYGVVEAERGRGRRRLYTRDQVDQLRFVKDQVNRGLSAADAHRLLRERLGEVHRAPSRTRASDERLVLLAERDASAAELSEFFLRNEGFTVDVASTAEAAEASFRDRAPALTIVDLLISGSAGADLCRRLKRLDRAPVLAVSGLDAAQQALAAGADAFLKKPLDPVALLAAVQDLLSGHALVPGAAS